MVSYSNPRMFAQIPNWPNGGKRVTATFSVEVTVNKGERAVRTTTGAPKKLTYARRMRIVDGDDGRTYIARDHGDFYSIMRGDMQYQEETAFPSNPRYAHLKALFD